MPLIKNVRARELVQGAVVLNLGDVREQADSILAAARAEADRVLAEARAEAARLTEGADERGHAEGFARGEAEGRAAGLSQGSAEGAEAAEAAASQRLAEIADGWTTALGHVFESRELLREEARRDLLRLGLAIAERVLGRLPAHDPTVVVDQVEAAIAMLAGATRLRIRIHPDDRAAVERHFADVVSTIHDASDLDVAFDTDLGIVRGGCVVSAGDGEVDSRLDAQISRIVNGVFPELLEVPAPAAPIDGSPAVPAAATPVGATDVPGRADPVSPDAEASTSSTTDAGSSSVEDIARDLASLGFDDLDAIEPPTSSTDADADGDDAHGGPEGDHEGGTTS